MQTIHLLHDARSSDKACELLAELLQGGPRCSSEILAAAEGAKISRRTMQRAATSLRVVKSKLGFDSGWTWALPNDEGDSNSAEGANGCHAGGTSAVTGDSRELTQQLLDRAETIAARLRKLEAARGKVAPIYARDPRLLAWVDSGISDPDLREAYELAVFALDKGGQQGPVTVGALAPFVDAVISEGAKAQQGLTGFRVDCECP